MKAEIIQAMNNVVRITFNVPRKDLMLVSRMPLEKNPFHILDEKGNPIFKLRIGAASILKPEEVVLSLPEKDEDYPVININMDASLSLDQVKYLTAIYTKKLTAVEKQILAAIKEIEETIKTVGVL